MNLKAIKPSYGDFGRVGRGTIIKDVSRDRAEKLIAGGAYVEASADDLSADEKAKAAAASVAKARGRRKQSTGAPVDDEKAKAAAAKAELEKLTNKQLQDIAAAEEIAVETDDNKPTLVDKIVAGRAAKG